MFLLDLLDNLDKKEIASFGHCVCLFFFDLRILIAPLVSSNSPKVDMTYLKGSSASTSDTRRVNLVTNPVISRERGKAREVFTTSGTYPWSELVESGIFKLS
jgi:hypothetical protein